MASLPLATSLGAGAAGWRSTAVVGGAPVTEDFAREIGADAYAFDGVSAVDRVRMLVDDLEGEG